MATFVERAVLMIDDKSTSKLSKINRALDKLSRQAQNAERQLSKVKLDGFDGRQIRNVDNATRSLEKMIRAQAKVRSSTVSRFAGDTGKAIPLKKWPPGGSI